MRGTVVWLVLRRLPWATRLDLVAAFVSNGPFRRCILFAQGCRGQSSTVLLLRCCVHGLGLGLGFLSAGSSLGRIRTRRRGDVFEFMFYESTDVLVVKWEL